MDDDARKKERIISRAAAQKPAEYPLNPSSVTGGVMPMTITGRFHNERARLGPDFTEAERRWRIKWHSDQFLGAKEPLPDPQSLRNEKYWWLRRLYRAPMDYVEDKFLRPRMHPVSAASLRSSICKTPLFYLFGLYMWYQAKYQGLDWEVWRRLNTWQGKPAIFPGEEGYPFQDKWEKWDWHNANFDARTSHRNVHDPNRWII